MPSSRVPKKMRLWAARFVELRKLLDQSGVETVRNFLRCRRQRHRNVRRTSRRGFGCRNRCARGLGQSLRNLNVRLASNLRKRGCRLPESALFDRGLFGLELFGSGIPGCGRRRELRDLGGGRRRGRRDDRAGEIGTLRFQIGRFRRMCAQPPGFALDLIEMPGRKSGAADRLDRNAGGCRHARGNRYRRGFDRLGRYHRRLARTDAERPLRQCLPSRDETGTAQRLVRNRFGRCRDFNRLGRDCAQHPLRQRPLSSGETGTAVNLLARAASACEGARRLPLGSAAFDPSTSSAG